MANRTSSAFRSALFLAFAGAGCNAILGIGDPRTEALDGGAEVPNGESGVSPTTDAARAQDGQAQDARTLLDSAPPLGCYKQDEARAIKGIPPTRHPGLCTAQQATEFKARCLGSGATGCEAYIDANKDCSRCIFGALNGENEATTPVPALIPASATSVSLNLGACASLVLNRPDCGVKITQQVVCLESACAECMDSAETTQCKRTASEQICKPVIDLACENLINANSTVWMPTCRGTSFDDTYSKVVNYLCGSP